jgi:hypothetical protein
MGCGIVYELMAQVQEPVEELIFLIRKQVLPEPPF